jgi:hypothetical protein
LDLVTVVVFVCDQMWKSLLKQQWNAMAVPRQHENIYVFMSTPVTGIP